MSNVPLPEPDEDLQGKEIAPGTYERGYRKDQLRSYAAAVSAEKDAEMAGLRAELLKSLADNAALRDERDNMAGAIAQLLRDNRDVHEKVVRPLRERVRVLEDARPEPDCRTCMKYSVAGNSCWTLWPAQVPCTNGDRYDPLPPVRLWRTA